MDLYCAQHLLNNSQNHQQLVCIFSFTYIQLNGKVDGMMKTRIRLSKKNREVREKERKCVCLREKEREREREGEGDTGVKRERERERERERTGEGF